MTSFLEGFAAAWFIAGAYMLYEQTFVGDTLDLTNGVFAKLMMLPAYPPALVIAIAIREYRIARRALRKRRLMK